MFARPGAVHPACAPLTGALANWDALAFDAHVERAYTTFQQVGITFTVYGDARGTERLIPFDPIPRIISAAEWSTIALGVRQRVLALNRFLHDIYHERRVLSDGIVPRALVLGAPGY